MFRFKRILIVSALILSSSCSSKLNDDVAHGAPVEVGGKFSGCLAGYDEKLFRYFSGASHEQEMSGFFDCVSEAFRTFGEFTRGRNEDRFEANELKGFLERYFLKTQKIPVRLLSELFLLKQALIGGSESSVSRAELELTRERMKVLKTEALRLLRYMPLRSSKTNSMSALELDRATDAASLVAKNLGAMLSSTTGRYSFERFEALLTELESVISPQGESTSLGDVRRAMPLIAALKSVFISQSKEGLESSDWPKLFEVIADSYGLYLKLAHLNASTEDALSGAGLIRLEKLIGHSKSFMIKIVSQREKAEISLSAFDDVIDALGTQTAFVIPYRGIALKLALRPIVQRLMGGTELGETGREAQALTVSAIRGGFTILEQWLETQKTLEKLYSTLGGTQSEYSRSDLLKVIEQMDLKTERVERLIRTHLPLFQMSDARASFFTRTRSDLYSYRGLSRMLWLETQARAFFRGYAGDVARAESQSYLYAQEWSLIYTEFSELAFDIGLFDRRKLDRGAGRFRDANLFTPSGDGDQRMTLAEATDLMANLMSARALARDVHEGARRACPKTGRKDPFGEALIGAKCFRRHFFDNVATYWDHMPELYRYYQGLKADQKLEFERQYESIVRRLGYSDDPIEYPDSESFSTFAHYIETLFAKYDRDRSGFLDTQETMNAFYRFENTLRAIPELRDSDQMTLLSLFVYIMQVGGAPECLLEKADFWLFSKDPSGWRVRADRGRVISVFSKMLKTSNGSGAVTFTSHPRVPVDRKGPVSMETLWDELP
jgi:hypothetical protein